MTPDVFISYAIGGLGTMCLAIGAYAFRRLDASISTLTNEIGKLKTEIAVLKVTHNEIDNLKNLVHENQTNINELTLTVRLCQNKKNCLGDSRHGS
jgi:prefoldin subunit 5